MRMIRNHVKRNGFVLTEIAASLVLAACGGGSPTDISGAVPLASAAPTGTTAATDTPAATDISAQTESEALRLKRPLSWTFCAPEGGTCNVAAPTIVRYGAESAFTFRTLQDAFACDNKVFGDPLAGTVKHCDIAIGVAPAP